MYIIRDTWINIIKNKKRYLIITCIIIVIISTLFIIRNITMNILKLYKETYSIKVTIETNSDNSNIESLTISEIDNYAKSNYVSSYYYIYNTSMISSNIYDINKDTLFNIVGYNSYKSMNEFINETYTIYTDDTSTNYGTIFQDYNGYYCMINYELANINNLSVGDTITLVNPNNKESSYNLTIFGIYKDNLNISNRTILTTSKVVEDIQKDDKNLNVIIIPTFIIDNIINIDNFTTEVYEKGLSTSYTINSNISEIEDKTSELDKIIDFTFIGLLITIFISLIILISINIRENNYIEYVLIILLSFIIGAFISIFLSNEIISNISIYEDINNYFNINSLVGYDYIDIFDIKILLELIIFIVLITIIGSIPSYIKYYKNMK